MYVCREKRRGPKMELWIRHCLEIRKMKKKQQKRPKKPIKLNEESNSRYDNDVMVT